MAQEFVGGGGGKEEKKEIYDLHGCNTEPAASSLELSSWHGMAQEQTLLLQREHRK